MFCCYKTRIFVSIYHFNHHRPFLLITKRKIECNEYIEKELTLPCLSSLYNYAVKIDHSIFFYLCVIIFQLGGELMSDDDEDINMFWDYNDELFFFFNLSVNTLLVSFPWLRFAPGIRSHMTRIYKAKDKLLKRFFRKVKMYYIALFIS